MNRIGVSPYRRVLMVGATATLVLLLESRLSVSQDIHFLLQVLWLGVAMSSLFMATPQSVAIPSIAEAREGVENAPEWHDSDRAWMQQHPYQAYLTNNTDREES